MCENFRLGRHVFQFLLLCLLLLLLRLWLWLLGTAVDGVRHFQLLILLILEGKSGGHEEGYAHQGGEDEKTDVVVPLPFVGLALCILEDLGMVEDHAHDKHGRTPTNRAKDSMRIILMFPVFSQLGDDCRVGQCDGRRTVIKIIEM